MEKHFCKYNENLKTAKKWNKDFYYFYLFREKNEREIEVFALK